MNVVIVESPSKAKTINKYLGDGYVVLASYGHIRDLPSKDGSVLPDDDFAMIWEADANSKKRMNEIAQAVKESDKLFLATDPDREGEAISWHVLDVLEKKGVLKNVTVKRVAFNAITKSAILKAMAEPRDLNQELVDAYLARRALDYLVGFTLSPVLWRKLPGSRSAGRVQSVALRLICDREREIELFDTTEYWKIAINMGLDGATRFDARLYALDGEKLGIHDLANQEITLNAAERVKAGKFTISGVERKPLRRHPKPPFTTSTLQQEAARKLGFTASRTMRVAQALYEGKSFKGETTGLITYMRTDGVSIADEAITACRQVIEETYGKNCVPAAPRIYKTKAKNAQEAHEAIRPTQMSMRPADVASALDDDERKLYDLIWKRTIASQMESARLEQTTVNILSSDGHVELRASGSVIQFDGFLKAYQEGFDDSLAEGDEDEGRILPHMEKGMTPKILDVVPSQHFTDPPPRYSEASLVKKLEELSIGRPSTYASIISVLQDRNYVMKDRTRFIPEDKGRLVTAFLESFFGRYVEYDFTANLEEQLDLISAGELDWKKAMHAFWQDFYPKTEEVLGVRTTVVLDCLNDYMAPHIFKTRADGGDPRSCPSCDDGRLSLKTGKFGAFIGCSNYPTCNFTRKLGESDGDGEQSGPLVLGHDPETKLEITLREGRFGTYLQIGEMVKGEDKPKRAGIPKDMDVASIDFDKAIQLLSLPRFVGTHPETEKPINAAIGRYGPYLEHDGKYVNIASSAEVFSIGINRAVVLIAEAPEKGKRASASMLKDLGAHPEDGKPVQILSGRYGPYVKHGSVNATLPKDTDPESVDLATAMALVAAKAGKKPVKKKAAPKKKEPAAKKAAPKTAAAKKAAPKKATAKKAAPKKATSKA